MVRPLLRSFVKFRIDRFLQTGHGYAVVRNIPPNAYRSNGSASGNFGVLPSLASFIDWITPGPELWDETLDADSFTNRVFAAKPPPLIA